MERKGLWLYGERQPYVLAFHYNGVVHGLIAHIGHFEGPFAIRDVFEDGYAIQIGGCVGTERFQLTIGHDEWPSVVVVNQGQCDGFAALAGCNSLYFPTHMLVLSLCRQVTDECQQTTDHGENALDRRAKVGLHYEIG